MTEAACDIATHRMSSGRYQFKYWQYDAGGNRHAVSKLPKSSASKIPDLVNTAYRNPGNLRAVYGLVFDLDAHRAEKRWFDAQGRLDWQTISAHLAQHHAEILRYVSHVVRSTNGQGLAVVVAINPLPIKPSTERCQMVALNLQSRLIALFSALGFGADPAARGLERDFPNWKDDSKRLFHNETLIRRIERDREPVLSQLHTYLNGVDRLARRANRLYPDARAEWKIARLIGWLLGTHESQISLPSPAFLTGEDVWIATCDLQKLTGLSDKFLRKFLKAPPPWLKASFCRASGWRLSVVIGRSLQWIYPRVEALLAREEQPRGPASFVARLKRPELVEDGERNHWLTSLALAYKWAGVEFEAALDKIEARVAFVAGSESSRNCRQARSIVKNIYRRLPHTFGMFAHRDLPEWLSSEGDGGKYKNGTTHRRGVAPIARERAQGGEESKSGIQMTATKLFPLEMLAAEVEKPLAGERVLSSAESGCSLVRHDESMMVKLVAVRRKQRVGIFDRGELVLCVTRRHYRAQGALDFLARSVRYAGRSLTIHTPHKKHQGQYFGAIDSYVGVQQAAILFGPKSTLADKMAKWAEGEGLKEEGAAADGALIPAPPF